MSSGNNRMKLNIKRIFVGNLPTDVTENDISKRLSEYGKIQSAEIKRRPDGSVFAYVNLETDQRHINECLEAVPKRKWRGQYVKVELAKESFLDRLARERQEQQATVESAQKPIAAASAENCKKNGNQHDQFPLASSYQKKNPKHRKVNNFIKFENEDSGSSDCEGMYNKKLPMFRGTGNSVEEYEPKAEEMQQQTAQKQKVATESCLKPIRNDEDNEQDSFHVNSQDRVEFLDVMFNSCNREYRKQKTHNNHTSVLAEISKKKMPTARSMVSEEKRLKSIEEKRKSFKNQLQTVKRALAVVDAPPNKKIIFSDKETSDEHTDKEDHITQDEKITNEKSVLFNDDEPSDEETHDFRIKTQFEGRKGQKLLELQSRYANDKRFTLDERFYESDDDDGVGDGDEIQESGKFINFEDEKKRQLHILQDVLGDKVQLPSEKRDKQSNNMGMLRFDPLKAEHKKFEVVKQNVVQELEHETVNDDTQEDLKEKKDESQRVEESKAPNVEVSKEKFYKVTDRLKETLKDKVKNDTQFSLLEMFGSTEVEKGAPLDQEMYEHSEMSKKKQIGWQRNPFKYDSSDSEDEHGTEHSTKPQSKISENLSQNANVSHAEPFFFKENDVRLKEGIEFITTAKRPGEKEFAERRRQLKQIIKAKVKNNLRKKTSWKKKLGGQKKNFSRRKKM